MKKKQVLALVMAAAMAASMIGCGSSTASSGDSSAAAATEAAAPETEAAEETALLGEEGDRTITVSVQTGTGVEEGWQAVADAYMEKHPEVTVTIDLKAEDGYDQWIQNAFTTEGTTADVVNINLAGDAKVGKSINFMDYIDNDSAYSDGTWRDQFEFGKQVVNLADNSFDALSLDSVQVLWLYNQDIFDELGLEVPTTWDEFVDVCQKCEDAGYQALAVSGDYDSFYSGKMGWLAQIYADQTYRSIIEVTKAQEGDYCYDPDIDGYFEYDPTDPFNDQSSNVDSNVVRMFAAIKDGTYKVDTAGMRTVWTNFANVFPKYSGGDAFWGTSYDGEKALFYQGKAAMFLDGGWAIVDYMNAMSSLEETGEILDSEGNAIEGAKSFTLGSFNMPSMEGDGIEAKARTIEVATGFLGAISKSQAHDDMVVDFLQFYSSQEGMTDYINAALAAGATVNGPSLVYGVTYPEEIENAFANLTFIGNAQNGITQQLARGIGESAETFREFYDYSYQYLSGEIDLDTWMVDHQANVDEHLEAAMAEKAVGMSDLENPANAPTGE